MGLSDGAPACFTNDCHRYNYEHRTRALGQMRTLNPGVYQRSRGERRVEKGGRASSRPAAHQPDGLERKKPCPFCSALPSSGFGKWHSMRRKRMPDTVQHVHHHPPSTQPQRFARSITVKNPGSPGSSTGLTTAYRHTRPPAPNTALTVDTHAPNPSEHRLRPYLPVPESHLQTQIIFRLDRSLPDLQVPRPRPTCKHTTLRNGGVVVPQNRMVKSTIIRTPNLPQLHGQSWSPSGWDHYHIDNLTEKAHQALAACMARLAPFGACCSQHQDSRQIRFTWN
jgi:hypothetical protein